MVWVWTLEVSARVERSYNHAPIITKRSRGESVDDRIQESSLVSPCVSLAISRQPLMTSTSEGPNKSWTTRQGRWTRCTRNAGRNMGSNSQTSIFCLTWSLKRQLEVWDRVRWRDANRHFPKNNVVLLITWTYILHLEAHKNLSLVHDIFSNLSRTFVVSTSFLTNVILSLVYIAITC